MNIKDLIQRTRASLGLKTELPNEAVLGFLRVLETLPVEELSCDEIFDQLDEYVDREIGAHDAARVMPLIREHLDICPDCCEKYDALLHVVQEAEKK